MIILMKLQLIRLCFVILILIIFIHGCKKDDSPICACGVENPQENLLWLKEILQKRFCTEIYSVWYNDEEYIGVFDCPVGADYGGGYYHCDGTFVCGYQGFTGIWDCSEEFTEAVKNQKLIYKQDKP
jgi:hypothetical protein